MLKKYAVIVCFIFMSNMAAQLENELYILQKNLTSIASKLTKPTIGGKVYAINTLDELNTYIAKYERVILDVYKDPCDPCQRFAKVYEKFAQKHPDIICLKVEGKKAPDIEKYYVVTGYPTIILYKNKIKFEQSTGASRALDLFEDRIKKFLSN